MLNINLKAWLAFLGWLSQTARVVTRKKREVASLDYNDLAFKLAVAENISETLPEVINTLQNLLADLLPQQEQGKLFILFSKPNTSESLVHHAQTSSPDPRLLQSLHQHFTVRQPLETHPLKLSLEGNKLTLFPSLLFQYQDQSIWLLYAFDHVVPSEKTLKWMAASIENTLNKGLLAWFQREEKVKMAVESERAIYAAELHDSLAQVLGYLKLKANKLDKICQQEAFLTLKPQTEILSAYTQCAYHQTRELITASRLTMQTENLSQGVMNSVREFEQQSAIVFELDNRLPLNILSPKQSLQILYIIRESLSNIVRHSHATHARLVLLLKNSQSLQIHIEDNGTGINADTARSDSFGLQIMKERAERIGAELTISNRADGGTRVELVLAIGEQA